MGILDHEIGSFGDRCGQVDAVCHEGAAGAGGQDIVVAGEDVVAKPLDIGRAAIIVAVSREVNLGDGDPVGDIDLVGGVAGVLDAFHAAAGTFGVSLA